MAAPVTDYISEIVQESYQPATDQDQLVFNKDFYKAKKEVNNKFTLPWLWSFFAIVVTIKFNTD